VEHSDLNYATRGTADEIVRNHGVTAPLGRLPSDAIRSAPSLVRLDPDELLFQIDDQSVPLTPKQFSILAYLIQKAGSWVTTTEIISEVLRTHHKPDTSLIRVHVHAIRRRLGEAAAFLQSDPLRSRGYRWSGGRSLSEPFAREPGL
jgi:DNA-binding response OmpR family regulator